MQDWEYTTSVCNSLARRRETYAKCGCSFLHLRCCFGKRVSHRSEKPLAGLVFGLPLHCSARGSTEQRMSGCSMKWKQTALTVLWFRITASTLQAAN
ncbi:hypothetical protein GGD65_007807 [Bradyrhizobium sp. CIR18]|nr:hypothetical protein [Bradyrhizobium sp. CIR18]